MHMNHSRFNALLAVCLCIVLAIALWNHYQQRQDNTTALIARTQSSIQRFAQQFRRLPCPATAESQGEESCATREEWQDDEILQGEIPWKTLGLPRSFDGELTYRLNAIYTQEAIFSRISAQALCRSGAETSDEFDAANVAAYTLLQPDGEEVLAETRRWHLLPALEQYSLPQLFIIAESDHELDWFTRCGAVAYPQRPITLPEDAPINSGGKIILSPDGNFMVYPTTGGYTILQRQNHRWSSIQKIGNGQDVSAIQRIIFAPDSRWMLLIRTNGSLSFHARSNSPEGTSFQQQQLPAEWQTVANIGRLTDISISPGGRWMVSFHDTSFRLWQRMRGAWMQAEGGLVRVQSRSNGTSAHQQLQWVGGAQPALWMKWQGMLHHITLQPAAPGEAPYAEAEAALLPFASIGEHETLLPAPDGSSQLLQLKCGKSMEIKRYGRIGNRFLPVAQHSIASDTQADCAHAVWESMSEILLISQQKQAIHAIALPDWPTITHSSAQD
jgi:hypothetical protein